LFGINQLHPITDTFVVRKGLDPGAPAILECYNTPPPLSPLAMSRAAFSSNYGEVNEAYTFACNNITENHCRFDGQLSHEYGGNWRIEYDLLVFGRLPSGIWQDPNDPWYNPNFTDRQIVRIDRFAGGNNEKKTISYTSPSRGGPPEDFNDRNNWTRNSATTSEAGLTGWAWPPVGADGKDVVFWLFDYSFSSPVYVDDWGRLNSPIWLRPRNVPWWDYDSDRFSGSFQQFLQNSPTDPHLSRNWQVSDDLFLPGQSGTRLISRKHWDKPWERYPHLM